MNTAKKIIDAIKSRGGYASWWDNADDDTRDGIIAEISEIIYDDTQSDIIDALARGVKQGQQSNAADLTFLEALCQVGVDSWEGYSEAQALVDEWESEKK